MRYKNLTSKFALLVCALTAPLAAAQGTSVIIGTVIDAASRKPVADVVVTATSPAAQGERTVVTDSTGSYRLPQLPAGVYTLRFEKETFKPYSRSEIAVRVDRTVRLNVEMQPEAIESETITVVGRAPTVDVGATATGINVGQDFIQNVAFLRPNAQGVRSFESLASVAPQVSGDTYGFGFNGATSPENLILVDGVNVNDAQTGTNGAQLPVEFIQETNIITGGYMAEYGRAGGGVINAVTKSGSNEFHGSVWANYTPGVLAPPSPEIQVAGAASSTQSRTWNIVDFGADLGGPIIKDRLWFYVGISPAFNRRQDVRRLNRYNVVEITDPGGNFQDYETDAEGNFVSTPIEGSDQRRFDDRRSIYYIAKLTFLINSDNNISVQVSGSNENRERLTTFQPLRPSSATGAFVFPQSSINVGAKYTGAFLDRTLLVDATAGWFRNTVAPNGLPTDGTRPGDTTGSAGTPSLTLQYNGLRDPISILDLEGSRLSAEVAAACDPGMYMGSPGLTPCPAVAPGVSYGVGGYGFMQENVNDRFAGRASLTYLLTALGHHVFKGGADVEVARYQTTKAYSGGVASIVSVAPLSTATNPLRPGWTRNQIIDSRRYAYLTGPDQVVTTPVVTVTPTTTQWGVYLQDSWAIMDLVTLNAGVRYDSQVLYDATGALGMALNNMWSPRVGAIYDFTQQGRSKVYANFARYYQSIPLNIADRALSGENQVGFNRIGTCEVAQDILADPSLINGPNCTNPANYAVRTLDRVSRYAIVTGQGRTPVDPDLQAQASDEIVVGGEYEIIPDLRVGVSYTRRWMLNVIEDMSNDEANTYFIGNPGFGIATDFPRATRDFDAVTVLASKAFSDGWLAQASYTWSYLRGNYAGFFRPETGQLDPGSNADFDLKSLLANRTGNLPGDRTHFIKVYASKVFDLTNQFWLLIGATYEGSSGVPISFLGAHPVYGGDEAFILPRGAAGRTDFVHNINLKAGAGYRIDKDRQIQFTVDALNVFNFAAATTVDETYTQAFTLPYVPASGDGLNDICQGRVGDATCVSSVQLSEVDDDGNPLFLTGDQLSPNFKRPTAYQQPLQIRFGIRFTF